MTCQFLRFQLRSTSTREHSSPLFLAFLRKFLWITHHKPFSNLWWHGPSELTYIYQSTTNKGLTKPTLFFLDHLPGHMTNLKFSSNIDFPLLGDILHLYIPYASPMPPLGYAPLGYAVLNRPLRTPLAGKGEILGFLHFIKVKALVYVSRWKRSGLATFL